MNAVIEKVTFTKRKEYNEVRSQIEKAIKGHDKDAVERALDKMLCTLKNQVGVVNQ